MEAKDVYAAAPRESRKFKLPNGAEVTLIMPSVSERIKWSKHPEDDAEGRFALIVSLCCEELKGEPVEDIAKNLDPIVLMEMATELLDMAGAVEKKKD